MNEPEDFLSRWSRRKREVAGEAAENNTSGTESEVRDLAAENRIEPALVKDEAAETGEPAFDISKLPSIEEITADTDIRPFLAAGVPAHLTQAALRKLWVTDPKIRDFIEIAENQWDFTTGNIPGFDYSLPENAKELVAQIFSKVQEVAEKAGGAESESDAQPEAPARPVEAIRADLTSRTDAPVQQFEERRDNSAQLSGAEQQSDDAADELALPLPRKHGSALPT